MLPTCPQHPDGECRAIIEMVAVVRALSEKFSDHDARLRRIEEAGSTQARAALSEATDHEARLREHTRILEQQRGAIKLLIIVAGIVTPILTTFLVKILHF